MKTHKGFYRHAIREFAKTVCEIYERENGSIDEEIMQRAISEAVEHRKFYVHINLSRRKLIPEEVREIRAEYSAGGVTQQELADKWGIDVGGVSRIVNRLTWRNV